eukprot:1161904-Pelagomonas_calceolata.AAC.7
MESCALGRADEQFWGLHLQAFQKDQCSPWDGHNDNTLNPGLLHYLKSCQVHLAPGLPVRALCMVKA